MHGNAETQRPKFHSGLPRCPPRVSPEGTPVTMSYQDRPYAESHTVILAACRTAPLLLPNANEQADAVQCADIAATAACDGRSWHPVAI